MVVWVDSTLRSHLDFNSRRNRVANQFLTVADNIHQRLVLMHLHHHLHLPLVEGNKANIHHQLHHSITNIVVLIHRKVSVIFIGRKTPLFLYHRLGKKHHKRRSVSPNAVAEQALYSDHEQQRKDQPEQSQVQPTHNHSPSPAVGSRSKQETANAADQQQQQVQATENAPAATAAAAGAPQGGVARSEEEQATVGSERRKSGSKRRHHRRDRYAYYNGQSSQGAPLENLFQQPYSQQQYTQQTGYYGEYQNELPPQLKVKNFGFYHILAKDT